MESKTKNLVFDIDGTIAVGETYQSEIIEATVKKQFGMAYFENYYYLVQDIPHFVFPGYYALFTWLHQQNFKISFFSAGRAIRNVELIAKIMQKTFGSQLITYQVFSREHCVDTTDPNRYDEFREKYQTFFYGQRKKKLAGIIVPETEIADSLLIDDDKSYMVKGEEFNFIGLRYTPDYLQDIRAGFGDDSFVNFHKAYYLAGLLTKIVEVADNQQVSLSAAAKIVQIDSEGTVLSDRFYYPSTKRLEYYTKGLEILQQFEPDLKFYYERGTPY